MSRGSRSSFPLGLPLTLTFRAGLRWGWEMGVEFKSWDSEGPQIPPHYSEAQGSDRALLGLRDNLGKKISWVV